MKKNITVCFDPDTLDKVKELAKRENQPLSTYVNSVLRKYVEEKEKGKS